MTSTVFQKLKDANALPSPTGVALRLLRLAGDKDATVEAIAAIIESDPALAGRVLKLANSASAGTSRGIASVYNAVVFLGMRALRNLALGISLISNNRAGRCAGFDFDGFWRESVARAAAAGCLSARLGGLCADEAFTIGLLGKVGQLALASGYPDLYDQALARVQAEEGLVLVAVEREMFGADHNELSADMMASWSLPDTVCEVVRDQDRRNAENADFREGSARTIAMLRLAGSIAKLVNQCQPVPDLLSDLGCQAGRLGITGEVLADLLDVVRQEWLKTAGILSLTPEGALTSDAARVEPHSERRPVNDETQPSGTQASPRCPGNDPLRILVVDDDPGAVYLLRKCLTEAGYQVMTASNTAEAIAIDRAHAPQLIITDWRMPGADGLDFCRRLRADEGGGLVYIIVLSAYFTDVSAVEPVNAGADEFLRKPYSRGELLARVRAGERIVRLKADLAARAIEVSEQNVRLTAQNEKLQVIAAVDELTGLANRREATARLAEHWSISSRSGSPLSCIMADIDHFKRFNDAYGHAAGDLILVEVAKRLATLARAAEKPCRFGGEEFLIICPGSPAAAAQRLGERLRENVAAGSIRTSGMEHAVTISLGVAERTADTTSPDDLLAASDAALYAAKRAGRNRVCVAGRRVQTNFRGAEATR